MKYKNAKKYQPKHELIIKSCYCPYPLRWNGSKTIDEMSNLSICKIVSDYWQIRLTKAGGKEVKPHSAMCPR